MYCVFVGFYAAIPCYIAYGDEFVPCTAQERMWITCYDFRVFFLLGSRFVLCITSVSGSRCDVCSIFTGLLIVCPRCVPGILWEVLIFIAGDRDLHIGAEWL